MHHPGPSSQTSSPTSHVRNPRTSASDVVNGLTSEDNGHAAGPCTSIMTHREHRDGCRLRPEFRGRSARQRHNATGNLLEDYAKSRHHGIHPYANNNDNLVEDRLFCKTLHHAFGKKGVKTGREGGYNPPPHHLPTPLLQSAWQCCRTIVSLGSLSSMAINSWHIASRGARSLLTSTVQPNPGFQLTCSPKGTFERQTKSRLGCMV